MEVSLTDGKVNWADPKKRKVGIDTLGYYVTYPRIPSTPLKPLDYVGIIKR